MAVLSEQTQRGMEADVSKTLSTSTTRAVLHPALMSSTFTTTHAHAYANKFWATKNFAAYGASGTWSSIR
jgi:hypothetical protein